VACYRKIIWCSGNLSIGTIGDGTGNPEKSDDYGLINTLLATGPDNPGLYFSGDDIHEELNTLAGASAINFRSQFYSYVLLDGDHKNQGEPVSPCLVAVGPCFIHLGVPDSLIAYGGCALINDFDVILPTGTAVAEFASTGGFTYVASQTTPTLSIARVIGSGFSYHYIRDKGPGFPPARTEHLRDILIWLQNIVPSPTGIGDTPMLTSLKGNYPNPFNPTTTIEYTLADAGRVQLKVYNVAGQLVRTLVDEEQTPSSDVFKITWDGRNDFGQSVSTGVYFYKMVTSNFSQTKKMVLLK
jgi:hypothetical protein